MTDILLPQRFLFRFAATCRRQARLWTKRGASLDESFRLPGLAELEGRPQFADVRAAWSPKGLAFVLIVALATAHRQGGKAVLEYLLEGEEL